MADLSSLLNPAPSSADPTIEQGTATDKSTMTGRIKSVSLPPPVDTGSTDVQQPSIKSPLDTLADAATSSVPLLSSIDPNTFVNLNTYAQSTVRSYSRPTSSRISPPLPSHAPAPTSPSFSPGLEQYHHPTSNEVRARRSSEAAEISTDSLPPLRRALPDQQHFPETAQSVEPLLQDDPPTPILPGITAAAGLMNNHSVQGHIDEISVPSQIRESSPAPVAEAKPLHLPPILPQQAKVKTETTDIAPGVTSPLQPSKDSTQTQAEATQEGGSSVIPTEDMMAPSSPVATPVTDSKQSAMLKPPPASGRKRPAPKKGTATALKPTAKKRKVDTVESMDTSSPVRGTPTSSRASKTPAPRNRKRESATPQRSSSLLNDEEDEDEDGVFCVCRGPDNHTWMIACDGPCEDWFHGKCINMTEKEGDLIEKYYCPNCSDAGKGETLWKRMCRLEGCIRPARISGTKKSKYCSDEHGCEFMKREALKKEDAAKDTNGLSSDTTTVIAKKGRRTNNSFADATLVTEDDVPIPAPEPSPQPITKEGDGATREEIQSRLRGGILQSAELKALVSDVNDVSEFHNLGNGLRNPSRDAEPNDVTMQDAPSSYHSQIPYNPAESDLLQTLTTKKDELRSRKKLLDDRDVFLILVRERAKTVLEQLRKKESNVKDICGFDVRLIWSDEEFEVWRNSPEGAGALKDRRLGAPTALNIPRELAPHLYNNSQATELNGDLPYTNGDDAASGPSNSEPQQADADEIGKGVCQKKRCERHKQWYKIQQQEIAFAKDEVRQGMRKLDEEEKGLRDRAKIRWLEAKD
ncbi:MAG: hypothetical protein LQ339_007098 [Xanthoria mediterranea]|nr:MAG: hypothetical protein LQ339_007098 [Xanthoria mediterranea]